MKAKIKIGDIELEFEYETIDELCDVYDHIMQEPIVENKQEDNLEDVDERIRKAMKEVETHKIPTPLDPYPLWRNPYFFVGDELYRPFTSRFTGDV